MVKIGIGGGSHWCTEALFLQVKGVQKVEQGWISSNAPYDSFSEAVIVHYDPTQIHLRKLITIHLNTHSCTSNHPIREKYRSAVYSFNQEQKQESERYIQEMQSEFDRKNIIKVLPFGKFKINKEMYQNYYLKNRGNEFCMRYIEPKLKIVKGLK